MTNFEEWLRGVTKEHSDRQIAAKAGLSPATFNRQIKSGMTAENAVALAEAYGASPVHALVALGLLRAEHIERASVDEALKEATDQQLIDAVARRLGEISEGESLFDEPVVIPIRPDVATPTQDGGALRSVARKRSKDRGGEEGNG